MDIDQLLEANVDYENGKKRFAGNEALYHKYLVKFLDDTHFKAAGDAYENDDYETLLKETHTLKGVAGTLGLTDIYKSSSAIVAALREERFAEIPVLFAELETNYKIIINILSN